MATLLLGACSSSGDLVEQSEGYARSQGALVQRPNSDERPGGSLIEGSENYAGPKTAAVTPVSGGRSGRGLYDEQLHAEIQRDIQQQLDRSGMFAGVVALDHPDEENEAEVIIEPVLVGPASYEGDVELRVRVTEKTKHRVVLDKRYEGGGRTNAGSIAIQQLEQDLGDRYYR